MGLFFLFFPFVIVPDNGMRSAIPLIFGLLGSLFFLVSNVIHKCTDTDTSTNGSFFTRSFFKKYKSNRKEKKRERIRKEKGCLVLVSAESSCWLVRDVLRIPLRSQRVNVRRR